MATLASVIQRGTRASQPAAASVSVGALFCVTDEGNIVERSNGTTWDAFSPSGSGTVTNTGTLANNALVKGNGGVDVSTITTGTGILTALGVNVGSAGAPVVNGGALGTPSSGNLANCTGYPAASLATLSSIYVNVQDQKAQNTDGGTFTSGSWRTRVLNTEVSDVGGLCSLASNQITLAAGTYVIFATAAVQAVNRNQLRLQNVTDTSTVLVGQSNYTEAGGSSSIAQLRGVFTIGASKALELQHQCQTTGTTTGFGVASNFSTEVYSIVELWKIG